MISIKLLALGAPFKYLTIRFKFISSLSVGHVILRNYGSSPSRHRQHPEEAILQRPRFSWRSSDPTPPITPAPNARDSSCKSVLWRACTRPMTQLFRDRETSNLSSDATTSSILRSTSSKLRLQQVPPCARHPQRGCGPVGKCVKLVVAAERWIGLQGGPSFLTMFEKRQTHVRSHGNHTQEGRVRHFQTRRNRGDIRRH